MVGALVSLDQVYTAAGRPLPTYSEMPTEGTGIKALHLTEIRAAVAAIY